MEYHFNKTEVEGRVLFAGLDFSMPGPGLWALGGPGGGGKALLLSCLSGHLPFDGTVVHRGKIYRDWTAHRAVKCGLIMLLARPALAPGADVTQTLFASSPIKKRFGLPDRQAMRRVTEELLCRYGLTSLPPWGEPVGNLSLGQQKLTALLAALRGAKNYLLIDEPLAGLDFTARRAFALMVGDLTSLGVTVLATFSRLRDAASLARGAWIVAEGTLRGFVPPPFEVVEY